MRTGNTLTFDGDHLYNSGSFSSDTEVILDFTDATHKGSAAFYHDGSGMPEIIGSCTVRQVNYEPGKLNVLYFMYNESVNSCVLNAQAYDTFDPPAQETHVFLLMWQSNMRPNTGTTGATETLQYPPNMLQWGRFGANNNTLIPASVPLDHFGNDLQPELGPGLTTQFFNRYQADNPNVIIVAIPAAEGGTGFIQNNWNKGDNNYEDAVTRTNLCLSENPDFIFKGILGMGGEADTNNPNFQTQMDAAIENFRLDITGADETTPFICGGLVPERILNSAPTKVVNDILLNVSCRVPYTACANSLFPTHLTNWDTNHLDSPSSIKHGDRFYDKYLELIGGQIL